jgi:hypothetical protein
MSTINDNDQFLVQRGTTSHKQSAVDLMSTIQDTDLMLIQRGAESYKVTCFDVKDQLGGGGVSGEVDQPVVLKPKDGAGSGNTVYSLSDKITKIEGGGSYTCETDPIQGENIVNYDSRVSTSSPDWDGPSAGPDKLFDGNITTSCAPSTYDGVITFAPFPSISYSQKVEVYSKVDSNGGEFNLNGTSWQSVLSNQWQTIATGSGSITSIAARSRDASFRPYWAGIRIDGEILLDRVDLIFPTNKGFNCFAVGDVVQGVDESNTYKTYSPSNFNLPPTTLPSDWSLVEETSISAGPQASAASPIWIYEFPSSLRHVKIGYFGSNTNFVIRVWGSNDAMAWTSLDCQLTGTTKTLDTGSTAYRYLCLAKLSETGEVDKCSLSSQTTSAGMNMANTSYGVLSNQSAPVKVISKKDDAAPYQISVDGGTWDDSNQSQVWSAPPVFVSNGFGSYNSRPITNAFNGVISTNKTDMAMVDEGGTWTLNFGSSFSNISTVEIQYFGNGTGQLFKLNGVDKTSELNLDATARTVTFNEAQLSSIELFTADANNFVCLGYIKVDGRLLVDAVNDSQVWSSDVSSGTTPSNPRPATLAFDNDLTTETVTPAGEWFTFTPTGGISGTSLRIYCNNVSPDVYELRLNSGPITEFNPPSTNPNAAWADLGDVIPGGTLTKLELRRKSATNHGVKAFEVDGKPLVDAGTDRGLGDNKLIKTTTYDTQLTVASSKDFASLSGGSFMTDGTGDPGPYSQTPYKLQTSEIAAVTAQDNVSNTTLYGAEIVSSDTSGMFDADESTAFVARCNNNGCRFTVPIVCNTSLQIYIGGEGGTLQLNESIDTGYKGIYGDNTSFYDGTSLTYPFSLSALGYIGGTSYNAFAAYKLVVDGVELSDAYQTLTFPGDVSTNPDLQYFRAGDVVQSDWNQDQVWSTGLTTSSGWQSSDMPAGAFNGNVGDVFAQPNSATTIVFTPETPITYSTSVEVYAGGSDFVINGSISSSIDAGSWTKIEGSGTINTLEITPGGVPNLAAIRVDGLLLVDTGVENVNGTKVVSVDTANNQMVVDGGNWDTSNQSQVWSENVASGSVVDPQYPITNAFDGDITSDDYTNTCFATSNNYVLMEFDEFDDATTVDIYFIAYGSGLYLEVNGTQVSPFPSGTQPIKSTIDVTGAGLQSVKWNKVDGTNFVGLCGIAVDGRLLVDAVNDSQVWSANATAWNTSNPPANIFDGSLSTESFGDGTNNSTVTISGLTANSSIEAYFYTGSLNNAGDRWEINNVDISLLHPNQGSSSTKQWVDLSSAFTFPVSVTTIKAANNNQGGMFAIKIDGRLLINPGVRDLGDRNVEYQTKGGKGDIVSVDAINNTLRINDTGDSDNRWIAENKADVEFKIAGPSYVDSPLLTSHVEFESSQFATTPAFDPNTGEPIDGLAKITWSLKPGNDAEYQLDAGTLNPYRPSGLQLNTTYTIKVKHTGARLGDSDWSLSTTFTTGASRTLNDHYMKQIKVLEEELREARSS